MFNNMFFRMKGCHSCEDNLYFSQSFPTKKYGIMLKPCKSYCIAGKKARLFTAKDKKDRLPSWCPKKIYPYQLNVYCLKDNNHYYESEY